MFRARRCGRPASAIRHPGHGFRGGPRGLIRTENGHKVLTVFVGVEPFDNGAHPVVEVCLREDRPHEVGFRVYATPGGKAMRSCILTATMGNFARLRRLYLKDRVEESRRVYSPFQPVFAGFAQHREWGIGDLLVRDGDAIAAMTPMSPSPRTRGTAPMLLVTGTTRAPLQPSTGTPSEGRTWSCTVNGRQTYWASIAPIPGGVAYENFELEALRRRSGVLVRRHAQLSCEAWVWVLRPVLGRSADFAR